jgi:hypothetical protein
MTEQPQIVLGNLLSGADFTKPPPGTAATVEQFWARLLTHTPEKRIELLKDILDRSEKGYTCFVAQHQDRLQRLEAEVAEYRLARRIQ